MKTKTQTNCEHELFLESESWIDENKVDVEAKCSLCNNKFRGILKKD